MKTEIRNKLWLLTAFTFVSLFVVASFGSVKTYAATITVNGSALPRSSAFPSTLSTSFEPLVPSATGSFDTSTADYGSEGAYGSYAMPTKSVCSGAALTSLVVHIPTTSVTFDPSSTGSIDAIGIEASIYNLSTGVRRPVAVVTNGTRFNGTFALSLDPTGADAIVRGLIGNAWTLSPANVPGPIDFSLAVSGLTASDYDNSVLTIVHDKQYVTGDPDSVASAISSGLPSVISTFDNAKCAVLAGTGRSSVIEVAMGGMMLSAVFAVEIQRRRRRIYSI